MPRVVSVRAGSRRFGAAFVVSSSLHVALALLAVALERRRPLVLDLAGAAAPRRSVVAFVPAELVEAGLVASPQVDPAPRTAQLAVATATTIARAALATARAEVAARPGGRAARPRARPPSLEGSSRDSSFVGAAAPRSSGDAYEAADQIAREADSVDVPSEPGEQPGSNETDPSTPVAPSAARPSSAAAGRDGEGPESGRGEGQGTGAGRGSGDDDVGASPWGKELRARILGDVRVDLEVREGRRVVSHEQATALRVRDTFPRMPEALWPGWRPYVVTLEVCVDEDGRVSEVNLLSSASPRLDQMVAAAARTWRYRPLELAGAAVPFCHGVVIKYEPW